VKGKRFLEVFAGCCNLSRAMKRMSVPAWAVDTKIDVSHNLLDAQVVRWLRWVITSGLLCCLWFAVPCGTYSRARRVYAGGPPPLRGDDPVSVYGLSTLTGVSRDRVDAANRLTAVVVRLCRLASKHHVPWVIENPLTSRLWIVPEITSLSELRHVALCRFDF
jgi:hypothetical protein